MSKCASVQALEYVNASGPDEEHQENLEWHVKLTLGQIRAIYEIDVYHRSYPWRVCLALNSQMWPELLWDMERTWYFVKTVVDVEPLDTPLAKALLFTRYQPFRDVMTKAE